MKDETHSDILQEETVKKIKQFEKIRGRTEITSKCYWDIVVLSALDPAQKKAYEEQLHEKINRKELPLFTKYIVVNDPVGYKVGNGGGVLAILEELDTLLGDKLRDYKVLILLSGGYSQRLPSASLLGKIFMTLPQGNPLYQMIELKLLMYIDFPQNMNPGIFVCSADTMELFQLEEGRWDFRNPGVTALAHPSPIDIGTTHGVYVLDDLDQVSNKDDTFYKSFMSTCKKFLHKPSKQLMRSSGAVYMKKNEEYVYSDSAYFMDMSTAMLLLKWYRKHGQIKCEIDAYGDFLQALGPEATPDYCKNTGNVTIALPELIRTREEIFDVLSNTPLTVLVLNVSKFYHIGTTKEYIDHFCNDLIFRKELNTSNQAMMKVLSKDNSLSLKDSNVFIHSVFDNKSCQFGDNVIIEYTILPGENSIGSNCIISNNVFPKGVDIPPGIFLHTVVIKGDDAPLYVTIAFGIDDNLKKCCCTRNDPNQLTYCGVKFGDILEKLKMFDDPWPADCQLLNLWNAKIFNAFYDPESSVRNAANVLDACCNDSKYNNTVKRAVYSSNYSMADILNGKDLEKILEMKNKLRINTLCDN